MSLKIDPHQKPAPSLQAPSPVSRLPLTTPSTLGSAVGHPQKSSSSSLLWRAITFLAGIVIFPIAIYWLYCWLFPSVSKKQVVEQPPVVQKQQLSAVNQFLQKYNQDPGKFPAVTPHLDERKKCSDTVYVNDVCNVIRELNKHNPTDAQKFFQSLEKLNASLQNTPDEYGYYRWNEKHQILVSLTFSNWEEKFSNISPKPQAAKASQLQTDGWKKYLPRSFAHWNSIVSPSNVTTVVEQYDSYPDIASQLKLTVRDITKNVLNYVSRAATGKAVFSGKGNDSDPSIENPPTIIKDALKHIHLFTEGEKAFYGPTKKELLGRFDILSLLTKMDYDQNWQALDSKNLFRLFFAAALNIGESDKAADFKEYSVNGRLLEEKYVADMARIADNALSAMEASGITDAVWFPFGMGAFLRKLALLDPTYKDPQNLCNLKEKIVAGFVQAFENHPKVTIHLCLPKDIAGKEPTHNYNAFINVLNNHKSRVNIYINKDATQLAQDLAEKLGSGKVGLLNGANRNLFGNHWFGDFAMTAIDENILRRSFLTAILAYILNATTTSLVRTLNELVDRVKKIGGQVIPFN